MNKISVGNYFTISTELLNVTIGKIIKYLFVQCNATHSLYVIQNFLLSHTNTSFKFRKVLHKFKLLISYNFEVHLLKTFKNIDARWKLLLEFSAVQKLQQINKNLIMNSQKLKWEQRKYDASSLNICKYFCREQKPDKTSTDKQVK